MVHALSVIPADQRADVLNNIGLNFVKYYKGKSMYKKFVLSLLSFVTLTHVSYAGRFVLEADLSDEQKAVISKKFVKSYCEKTGDKTFSPYLGIELSYPWLEAQETMHYSVALGENVDKETAEWLAEAYVFEKQLPLDKLQVSLDTSRFNHSSFNRNVIRDGWKSATFNIDVKADLENINPFHKIHADFIDTTQEEIGVFNSGGLIIFGEGVIQLDQSPESPRRTDYTSLLNQMEKRMSEIAAADTDPLILTFKTFHLKHYDDEGKVTFDHLIHLN